MDERFLDPSKYPYEELKEVQWKKLKKQIQYIYDNSPLYYKKKFDEIGVKPEDIKTWDDFRNLPIMGNKEEERQSQEDSFEKEGHYFSTYLCAPLEKLGFISSTGGTTGVPTFSYLYTREDMKSEVESTGRIFRWAGLRDGDRIANLFAQSMHWFGFVGNHIMQAAGFVPVPIGAEAGSERMLNLIDVTKPRAIAATPPLVEHLIERCPEVLKKDVKSLGIEILVLGGAPGAGIPSVKKKLEEAYGAKVYDIQPMWVSCDADEYYGMHFINPDHWVFAEDLIDRETHKPVPLEDGAIGVGLATMFYQAKPMFKYFYGDVYQVFTKECPGCGFKGPRIKIVGRADEMLIVKGVNVYPAAVKGVVNSFLPRVTGEMRIVLDKPGPAVDPPLRLKVEHAEGLSEKEKEQLSGDLISEIKKKLEVRPSVQLVPPMTFERAGGVSAKGTLVEKTYKE